MIIYEATKKEASGGSIPGPIAGSSASRRHHYQQHHRPNRPSSRNEEVYEDDADSDEGNKIVGRESAESDNDVSNADIGIPTLGSSPGPAGGFTAVNKKPGGLDPSMFKEEE
jgi:hypothetical protein